MIAATAFTSACASVNAVEQPARLPLEPRPLLQEWKRSYARGTAMQLPLAVLAATLGVAAAIDEREPRWLGGSALLLVLLSYTLIVIVPINHRLTSVDDFAATEALRQDVVRWGRRRLTDYG